MSKSGKQLCTQKSKQKAEILTADKKNEQDIRIFVKVKKLYKAILSLITFLWMCRSSSSPFLSEFYLPLCGKVAHASGCMWRAEDNFMESVSPPPSHRGSGA